MPSGDSLGYAEFAVTTNFSFLRGASSPEDMVAQAIRLGLSGIGIADRNSVAGVVRAFTFLRDNKDLSGDFRVVSGTRLVFSDGTPDILAYPADRAGWGRLCRLLTTANRRTDKGECLLRLPDLLDYVEGLQLIVMPESTRDFAQVPKERAGEAEPSPTTAAIVPFPSGTSRRPFGSPPPLTPPDKREGGQGQGSSLDLRGSLYPAPSRLSGGVRGGPSQSKAHPNFLKRGPNREPNLHTHLQALEADPDEARPLDMLRRLRRAAPHRVWVAAHMAYGPQMRRNLARRASFARRANVPLIAINDVVMHIAERRELADVVTCIREGCTLDGAGLRLAANAERHLKPPAEMARLFAEAPDAIDETLRFLDGITFSLTQLKYDYPDELRGDFATEQDALEHYTWEGARERYRGDIPDKVQNAIRHEFKLIAERDYAAYFLTVHDIVKFARSKDILCQGRGSAANSAVCFCLHITDVDPNKHDLLFERFISSDRNEPPDIDVDFEHERREIVMQHLYNHYGRDKAALAATVVTYRTRSSIREVGKVFGFTDDFVSALSGTVWGWWSGAIDDAEARRLGFDPDEPTLARALKIAAELVGFPRHLSQHTGGFVITRSRLDESVPIANAAMEDRTTIEWDKDDLDAVGMLKVDVLALGMLTALKRGFDLVRDHYHVDYRDIARLPVEEPEVYAMIQRADTIGVFQIESRAQMSMLPRLKPEKFYDLVIEVAIVRPGPIQGDMVHPYLRRRLKLEPVTYPLPELEQVLHRTLGVPLFQEQAMRIAIVAAGFTPSEADGLRRAMATFKKGGQIEKFREKMVGGMVERGYPKEFAERVFSQIEGFGTYGFPESHAASFALLVYASAWMKCFYPDVFLCAMLNSQPMGFYAPSQLVRDARDHGVVVHEVDVNVSTWDSLLEGMGGPSPLAGAACRQEGGARSATDEGSGETIRASCRGVDAERFVRPLIRPAPPATFLAASRSRKGRRDSHGTLHPRHAEMADHILTKHAVRLGFRQIKGLTAADMETLVAARGRGYDSVRDLWLRTGLPTRVLERLAEADAFGSLGLDRRDALWAVRGLNRAGDKDDLPLLRVAAQRGREPDADLPPMPLGEHIVEDYRHLGLSLKGHPVSFVRARLAARKILRTEELAGRSKPQGDSRLHQAPPPQPGGAEATTSGERRDNSTARRPSTSAFMAPSFTLPKPAHGWPSARPRTLPRVTVAGLVLVRQRPGSSKGVIFMTIEDETGTANIIVWPKLFEKLRSVVIGARFVAVTGRLQNELDVVHVVAEHLEDLTSWLSVLSDSGPQVSSLAPADHVKSPLLPARSSPAEPARAILEGNKLEPMEDMPEIIPRQIRQALPRQVNQVLPKGRNFH